MQGHSPESIQSIEIRRELKGKSVTLKDAQDVRFILSHLDRLETHKEMKVNPEFYLEFLMTDGQRKLFKMEKRCIGPAVRASDAVTRWYFDDDTLYRFILDKLPQ